MSGANSYVAIEADRLDQLTDDLNEAEWNDTWNVYVERGFDAAARVAYTYKSDFQSRYGMGAGITLEKALEYREKAAGNAEALKMLDALIATMTKDDQAALARNVAYKQAAAPRSLVNEITNTRDPSRTRPKTGIADMVMQQALKDALKRM